MKIDPAHISLDFPRTASIAVDVDGPCWVTACNVWEAMARFCLYLCADTLPLPPLFDVGESSPRRLNQLG
jgi:hypothetical protein